MRRLSVLVGAFMLASSLPSSAHAQAFNLASLALGSNVLPIYVESDQFGPKLALLQALDNFVLVNPRRAAPEGQAGLFCWEFVAGLAEYAAIPNPSKNIRTTTVNIGGQTKAQIVDLDASDGVAPWLIVDLEFSFCR